MKRLAFCLAILSMPAFSASDLAREISKCSTDKNNVTRLACYDALSPKAAAQDPAKSSAVVSKWKVEVNTSPIDDSKNVTLVLTAESSIEGWPAKKFVPALLVRCKEKTTDAYIVTGMAPAVEYGVHSATVTLRLDKNPAFKVAASKSTDGEALFFPSPISLIKRIINADTMLFQFVPFNSGGQMTTFDVRGLGEAIKPLREACKW